MHDSRLEDLLRRSLRDEGAALPFTVTVEQLERRVAARRGVAGATRRRWMLAASLAGIAILGGGAAILLGARSGPDVGASRSPTSVPTITLPDASTLLSGLPGTTLLLDGADGPAEVRLGDPDPTDPPAPATTDAGRIAIEGPFALAMVCGGSGDQAVRLDDGTEFSVIQATMPCDGEPRVREYLSGLPLPADDGFAVTVTAVPGSSWRFAIGAYPPSLGIAPDLPAIEAPDDWTQILDTGTTLISPTTGTGVATEAPAGASTLDVLVSCAGTPTVTLDLDGASSESFACTEAGSTHAFTVEAPAGENVRIRATADGFTWIRIVIGSIGGA